MNIRSILLSKPIAILLIIAAVLLCYANSLGGNYLWDDRYYVADNPAIRSLRDIPRFFTTPSTLSVGPMSMDNYRPLVPFSFALDHAVWGLDPFGYHLTNVLFHMANAILAFLLLELVTRQRWLALFGALFFAVHPAQIEAVTWISGRANVLMGCLFLGSFLLFVIGRQRRSSAQLLPFSLVLFGGALLAKETAVALPFMVAAYDLVFRPESRNERAKRPLAWLPFFAVLAAYLCLRSELLGKIAQCPYWGGSAVTHFMTVPKTILIYAGIVLLPLNLCADRTVSLVSHWMNPSFLAAMAFLILSLVVFILLARRRHQTAFLAAWFFIALLPCVNLVPIKILVAERFLYLPLAGAGALLGSAIACFLKSNAVRILLAATAVAVLGFTTVGRNNDWQNEMALQESAVAVEPLNARAHVNLGVAYYHSTPPRTAEAEREFKKAIAVNGSLTQAYISLGTLYFEAGRMSDAETTIRQGLAASDGNSELLNLLALSRMFQGFRAEAEDILRTVAGRDPSYLKTYLNLGRLLTVDGRHDDGIMVYNRMLEMAGDDYHRALAWLRIGSVYEAAGNTGKAELAYNRVIESYPHETAVFTVAMEQMTRLKNQGH